MLHPSTRFALHLAGVASAYFLAGRLGLSLAVINPSASAVWPAAGVAVAALLLLGLRAWPAVAVGAFLVTVTGSSDVLSALAIAGGNTLEAVLAAALTMRAANGRRAYDRCWSILRFSFAAAAASTIAASVGTATLWVSARLPAADAGVTWLTWWLGDASSILLVAPLIVLWATPQPPPRAVVAERVALVSILLLVLVVVFGPLAELTRGLPIGYMMIPLLAWSAFRFGTRTTATMTAALSAVAVQRTLQQLGPFSFGDPAVSLLVVQSFVALLGVLMLSAAAEVAASYRLAAEMRELNDTLERRVTERTAELTRANDRLVEAQDVAHVGSWEWDMSSGSLWWSAEMCRIFGSADAPASYEDYLGHLHQEDRARTDALVRDAVAARRAFSFEHRIVRPDGEVRVLHARGRIELDAAGRPARMVGTGHDVTDWKKAEEERLQLLHEQSARLEAEEANRVKDAFLATLSHELRTPLNAALGWTHILRVSPRLEARDARVVQTIYRNLLLQSRLVSDILDISRIAKQGLSLESENVDLSAVAEGAIEMVQESATSRNVRIDVRTTGAAIVKGDGRRLQQVAWNLLSNAVKFAAEGGQVLVTIVEGPETVELRVEDNGPGIAPEFLPHVFEQFRQADASVTREHGGLGLGLAIAHHIVSLHRGTIEAGNRPAGGAMFVVRLPRPAGGYLVSGVERSVQSA